MNRIASFSVDHDYITPGIYLSRVDGDINTYDLRTRTPNSGDLMDNATVHSFEHMFATLIRNGDLGARIIYFGPMGCQTGFYLLTRGATHSQVINAVIETLNGIIEYSGDMPGGTRKECGNYKNLSLALAQAEAARYLDAIRFLDERSLAYPNGGDAI